MAEMSIFEMKARAANVAKIRARNEAEAKKKASTIPHPKGTIAKKEAARALHKKFPNAYRSRKAAAYSRDSEPSSLLFGNHPPAAVRDVYRDAPPSYGG